METVAPTRKDTSARHLTKNYVGRFKNPSELKQGEQKLYSFYAPSLEAGDYTIDTTQKINVPSGDPEKIVKGSQTFTVVAPRFTLPAGSIHSMYPAPGRAEPAKTLPHVVLNDPHLPWERDALGDRGDDEKEYDEKGNYVKQNQVPWLAVLVFTQEELRLDKKHLKRDSGIFPKTVAIPPLGPEAPPPDPKAPPPDIPQNKTLAINMTIKDLLAVNKTTTPIRDLPRIGDELSCTTDVIFLQKELFNCLVTEYDEEGKPVNGQGHADVSRYKYLAHARKVSTIGMVIDNPNHEAFFSVVISHRVGPLDLKQPTPVVVHLVSIEGVGKMEFPITADFVALSSLDSWTYTCLPAHSMDILYSFKHLGDTLNMLRPSWDIIKRVEPGEDGEKLDEKRPTTRVGKRMYDGYSLVRYITQTGEETVAFTRGPFTPTTVQYPLRPDWGISTFGTDLQIFDTELGVMDITYSSAWQLGKTLALADHPFAAALSRVRTHILDEAMSRSKVKALQKRWPGIYKTRAETLRSLLEATESLHLLLVKERTANHFSRAPPPRPYAADDYSHGSDLIKHTFDLHSHDAGTELSRAKNREVLHEHNEAVSTDWMMVLGWILDRMYLDNIPAHYLISDQTHLPPESLRFFHIDRNWIDAMLDGALSIANHMQCYDSKIRTVIKIMVNAYFKAPLDTEPDSKTDDDANSKTSGKPKLLPQIPTYGFLLRSDICSQFPHLVIEAEMPNPRGAPILYHKNLDKGVMLCLFDRVPSANFKSLTFTQPPHQQCFSAGDTLDHSAFKMIYKHPFPNGPVDEHTYVWDNPIPVELDEGEVIDEGQGNMVKAKGPPVFLWGDKGSIRTLLFPPFAQTVFEFNKKPGKTSTGTETKTDTDPYPGAAMVGIQLGSAIYKLKIQLDSTLAPATTDCSWDLKGLDRLNLDGESVAQPAADQARLLFKSPKCVCNWPQSSPVELVHPEPRTDTLFGRVPLFSYKVFSVQSWEQKLLMTSFKQDLVFSIVLKVAGGDQMRVEKVVVQFPIGRVIKWESFKLMETYDGSVKMLSNLRFNVLAQLGNNTLSVTLLPRTRSGNLLITRIEEMSFLMSGVKVNRYSDSRTVDTISAEVWYLNWPRNPEVDNFEVKLA